MAPRVERHERAGAAITTTSPQAKPAKTPPPTPAEIQARQRADAARGRQQQQAHQAANLGRLTRYRHPCRPRRRR
jgi:hypothetical protein